MRKKNRRTIFFIIAIKWEMMAGDRSNSMQQLPHQSKKQTKTWALFYFPITDGMCFEVILLL